MRRVSEKCFGINANAKLMSSLKFGDRKEFGLDNIVLVIGSREKRVWEQKVCDLLN